MQFSSLSRITGEAIASVVICDLEALNLDICNVRGQGYDGAANMSSDRVGLQAYIYSRSLHLLYIHTVLVTALISSSVTLVVAFQ